MAKILYTARAHVTGGREGHGRTDDGVLEVDLGIPEAMGGAGGGTNPEQLFAIGFAACFESALSAVARRRHLEPGEVAIDSAVSLFPNGDRGFALSVALDVTVPGIDDAAVAADLVRAAHEVCPYSNATRGNIEVELLLAGKPI
jgi:osmotically inducible protein OsmC